MPLSVIEMLEIFKVQATKISLEMADKSLKKAYGLVEDVLVKVEDFYIPADFIILDTREDEDESIILGRPFLATANAMINVARGELVLQLWENHILFKMPKPNSFPKGETTVQYLVFQPSLSVQSYTEPTSTKTKFGVENPSSSTENKGTKKNVPKGWRDEKIPTEGLSPGMRVVFTDSPVIPHTVNKVLSLEYVELIHESTEKFTVRGKILSPYPFP